MSLIAIVEDDRAIAAGLAMNLRHEGHHVRLAHDGPSGLALALEPDVDLVVLDLMLPGMNGYEVLQQLRSRLAARPVLILSAKGAEADKVVGLDLGADDYLAKPFGLPELLARVKALLRRAQPVKTISFGSCTLDLDAQLVRKNGTPVELTAQELRLLRAFVEHEGRALSREQLVDFAWGLSYEGTLRTVDTFVRQLRVKVEDDPDEPRHLVTVRGHGYRFER